MPGADQAARLLVNGLCFTKFISIFSMLFGYGLLMQLERAEQSGHSPAGFAARRLGTLAVFGAIHAFALWYGDILFLYAACGAFVVFFRKVPPRELLILAGILLGYVTLMRMVGEFVNVAVLELMPPGRAPGDARGWEAIVASRGNPFSDVWIEGEKRAYGEGPFRDMMTFRVVQWCYISLSMSMGSWCQIVALFLGGMWLYRVRFFAPEQAALRRRVLMICLPIGLLIEAVAAGFCVAGLRSHVIFWAVGAAVQAVSPFFLPLGYVALFTWLCERLPRLLTLPVISAGRMALTVYLSETLIATSLAYYWGLGWFGRVGPAKQVLWALAIWAALVLFSTLWLRVFPQGPMEWLWRRLEYGRPRKAAGES
jgi:uncharacterized protein